MSTHVGGRKGEREKEGRKVVLVGRNPPASAGDARRTFNPWVGKIPERRAWQATPAFLPGEPHGQRSLVGYSPRGHKEADTTEVP